MFARKLAVSHHPHEMRVTISAFGPLGAAAVQINAFLWKKFRRLVKNSDDHD